MYRKPTIFRRRTGFTLLELILAMALSVMVLMAISMAINIHYRMLDVRRTNVEESQLARAALRHIADDLRSAVQFAPPDLSGLDAMSSNMSGALSTIAAAASSGQLSGLAGEALGGTTGAGGQTGGATGGSATQQSTGAGSGAAGGGQAAGAGGAGTGQAGGGATASTGSGQAGSSSATGEEEAAVETTTSSVKLYGSSSELRFDISRLPRVDQYQALMTDDALGAIDIPSDVKTVVYFVRTEDSEFGLPQPAADGIGIGLMRTEIDQAVSSWAEENGDTTSQYAGAKLLAKEVTGLAFQYWNGAEWATDWDSDEMGGLPLAVEINLTIQPSQAMSEEEIANLAMSDSTTLPAERTYRLVVHLPTAVSVNTRTLETDAAEIAAAEILPSEPSGTQTASSGSGSSTGGQTGGTGGMGAGGGFGGSGFGGGGRGGRGEDDGGRRGRDSGRGVDRRPPRGNQDELPIGPNGPMVLPRILPGPPR